VGFVVNGGKGDSDLEGKGLAKSVERTHWGSLRCDPGFGGGGFNEVKSKTVL